MKQPEQPKQLSFKTTFEPDRLEVKIRTGSTAIGCFMLFWLAGWSVGCVLLFVRIREDPQPEMLMFAIPFWVSWIFVVVYASYSLFGREIFKLDEQGASFRRRMILPWGRVSMPLEELIRFGSVEDETNSATGQSGVVVNLQTIGRPIRFGSMLVKPERNWLVHTLNQKLYAWQRLSNRKPTLPVDAPTIVFGRPLPGELLSDERTLRTTSDLPLEPPSDSRWKRHESWDSVTYSIRGRFYLSSIAGMLFLNLFVNGIIGVFMSHLYSWGDPKERLYGIEWLFRFLFLIPFELVGLALFLGLLLIVLEPLRVWSWRFAGDRIVWKLTWLGLGFRKTYRIAQADQQGEKAPRLDRLEVRRIYNKTAKLPNRLPLGSLWAPQGCATYNVAGLDAQGRTVAEVEGLTFGEACWMADSLLRSRAEWFR
ncbi:MAG: hypothetical protein K8U03_04840 [Planctomycetia bacterium]|nr:hypothetical protein [Planctomycetia bacterium]